VKAREFCLTLTHNAHRTVVAESRDGGVIPREPTNRQGVAVWPEALVSITRRGRSPDAAEIHGMGPIQCSTISQRFVSTGKGAMSRPETIIEDHAEGDHVQPGQDSLQRDRGAGPTVQEVHVDFLLEEEFSSDPEFLRSFVKAARQPGTAFQVERVRHSVSDQSGEADLIVVYRQLEGAAERVAILIEDKIRASFQPRQAERYRERGDAGTGLEWNRYWTCLVAPKSYMVARPDHGFDAAVALEQVKEWLAVSEPRRREFKVGVIDQAIEKALRTGVQNVDPVMTAFRANYFAFFEEFFKDRRQDVHTRPPAPTWAGDSWFDVRSRLLPDGAYINHKSEVGFVDLTFPKTSAALLRSVEPWLEDGMRIEQTNKSAAIRVEVSTIKRFDDFAQQRPKVAEALSSVDRLLQFYVRERSRLEPVLRSARTGAVR